MSQNLIDYATLEDAAKNYEAQATVLEQLVTTLRNQNFNLAQGWNNLTSAAFLEKYNTVYEPTFQGCGADLLEFANFLRKYSSDRQSDDANTAQKFS